MSLIREIFFERFPEGIYEIEGKALDGEELESETEVTHIMPAPPCTIGKRATSRLAMRRGRAWF